ncbi:MAG: radical SAM protein [Spirochaetales bacterium]|nr:radical SAM protein [Spirochaetales bacterium]
MNKTPFITRLSSGGIITNYNCTSRCGHCLYACGPGRAKDYIATEAAQAAFRAIRHLGCYAVHVGGGEPFLNTDGLLDVIRIAAEEGVAIDYIETNSSWYNNPEQAEAVLRSLLEAGCSTLLLSISPFHNERIPFARVRGVREACRKTGMGVFPWVDEFLPDLARFDSDTPHSLAEYEKAFGPGYIASIPGRYRVAFRGRAIETYRTYMKPAALKTILASPPCGELIDTSHFHADLYGNYLPGLCSGLAVRLDDLGGPLDDGRYPYLTLLLQSGVRGLYEYAKRTESFTAEETYVSKCDLCQETRRYLVCERGVESPDLKPEGFYRALKRER